MIPCPFCGATDTNDYKYGLPQLEVANPETNVPHVACRVCGARGPDDITPQLAIKKWNRRVHP